MRWFWAIAARRTCKQTSFSCSALHQPVSCVADTSFGESSSCSLAKTPRAAQQARWYVACRRVSEEILKTCEGYFFLSCALDSSHVIAVARARRMSSQAVACQHHQRSEQSANLTRPPERDVWRLELANHMSASKPLTRRCRGWCVQVCFLPLSIMSNCLRHIFLA